MTKLAILIPCLPEPESQKYLQRLNAILDPQIAKYAGQVTKIIDERGRHVPTGTKRNDMIAYCDADYMAFCDCDDVISKHYVKRLMEGIDKGVDVVTFCGWMTTDGAHRVDFIIKLGEKYEERGGKYYRFPNHITCMKRELVEKIKFPPVWNGEDYQWSKRINDLGLLKTEHHITDQLYHYDFKQFKPRNPRR
jgi:glycosyltransferase involved in cell wall biosynthesis